MTFSLNSCTVLKFKGRVGRYFSFNNTKRRGRFFKGRALNPGGVREPESRLVAAAILDFQNLRELETQLVALSTLPNLPLLLTSKMAAIALNQTNTPALQPNFEWTYLLNRNSVQTITRFTSRFPFMCRFPTRVDGVDFEDQTPALIRSLLITGCIMGVMVLKSPAQGWVGEAKRQPMVKGWPFCITGRTGLLSL